MGSALETIENRIGNKTGSRRIHVLVAVTVLLVLIEPQGMHEMEMLSRPRHRDIEQAPLFFDLFGLVRRHVRRDATVRCIEDEHHVLFLSLR